MEITRTRCLVLACGNTLRGDDGVGPWLAVWAEERFKAEPRVRVISRQQWTPELAEEIPGSDGVLFIDCSIDSAPGAVSMRFVEPAADATIITAHRLGAPELLALTRELYEAAPCTALLLTVGAASIDLREDLSAAVRAALPEARDLIEKAVLQMLA